MDSNILKYNDFNESMMVNVPNKDGSMDRKLDFRKFCSWDDVTYKPSMLRFKQNIRIYYSPVRNEIISIESQDAFTNLKNFPFKRGDSRSSVREWVERNSKYEIAKSHTKRFRGPK